MRNEKVLIMADTHEEYMSVGGDNRGWRDTRMSWQRPNQTLQGPTSSWVRSYKPVNWSELSLCVYRQMLTNVSA